MVSTTGDAARGWGAVVPMIREISRDTWYMPALPLPETLEDTLASWRAWSLDPKRRHSQRTVDSRVGTVRRLALVHDPMTVTGPELEAWLDGLDVGDNSRATYWTQIRAWYAWLARSGRRADNPTATMDPYRAERGTPRPLSEADVLATLAACSDPRTGNVLAYVTLGAFAGLRVHEIAKVRGEDLYGGRLRVLGKGRHDAPVPVHWRVEDLAAAMPSTGYWFPSQSRGAGHVSRVSVGNAISRAFDRAGVVGTPHQLRHYFGTQVYQGTGDIYEAQKALRHKSIASTQIYAQVADDRLRAAVNAVGPPRPAA